MNVGTLEVVAEAPYTNPIFLDYFFLFAVLFSICMEKPLETAWVGLQLGEVGYRGITRVEGVNSVNQIDGFSDMALACLL